MDLLDRKTHGSTGSTPEGLKTPQELLCATFQILARTPKTNLRKSCAKEYKKIAAMGIFWRKGGLFFLPSTAACNLRLAPSRAGSPSAFHSPVTHASQVRDQPSHHCRRGGRIDIHRIACLEQPGEDFGGDPSSHPGAIAFPRLLLPPWQPERSACHVGHPRGHGLLRPARPVRHPLRGSAPWLWP